MNKSNNVESCGYEFIRTWNVKNKILPFFKDSLSNFAYFPFYHDGHLFYNSEQAFMYEKAKMFDPAMTKKILKEGRPWKVKQLGRQVRNYNDTVWNESRYSIMKQIIREKANGNKDFKQILLSTEDAILVEASPYDRIWGVGIDSNNPNIYNPTKWSGYNLLGKALMEVRNEIK